MGFNEFIGKLFGNKATRDMKEIKPWVDKIKAVYPEIAKLSNDELRAKTVELKKYISDSAAEEQKKIEELKGTIETTELEDREGIFAQIDKLEKEVLEKYEKALDDVLPQAFAIVKDTARRFSENPELVVTATDFDRELAAQGKDFVRIEDDKAIWQNHWIAGGNDMVWSMVHYDVQLFGGVVLHKGKIAEMATGEGKTLVATLPVFLNALTGNGVHVVTVNDYLSKRDSEWMGPLYQFHGLSVDCIDKHQPNSDARRRAYMADITFGTNNEFGFDYLRDNMAVSPKDLVQRKHNYAIVDEVDSVLIDDARTPLIISGPVPKGEDQLFEQLRPLVERLFEAQKKLATQYLADAKRLIASDDKKDQEEGFLALFRSHKALPKNKPLIKFLSEQGIKAGMLKTEEIYMEQNNKRMPEATDPLYFVIDEKQNSVDLTDKGIDLITGNAADPTLFVLPDITSQLSALENETDLTEEEKLAKKDELMTNYAIKSERVHTINQLLKAYAMFEKDDEYVVIDGQVKIVDEQTGRIMEGRRYSDGLHQAIEAKEGVKVEAATQTFATITLQNYFRMYHKLSGMTGTAETEAGELWDIYKLDVVVIPTNRPIARKDMNDRVYKTKREKYKAVIEEIEEMVKEGRPVLVGTTSVEISEMLSKMLAMRKIEHNVLNAKLHQREADIVAQAGQKSIVTIATNMAGRGTDIKLSPEVKAAGGLAIIYCLRILQLFLCQILPQAFLPFLCKNGSAFRTCPFRHDDILPCLCTAGGKNFSVSRFSNNRCGNNRLYNCIRHLGMTAQNLDIAFLRRTNRAGHHFLQQSFLTFRRQKHRQKNAHRLRTGGINIVAVNLHRQIADILRSSRNGVCGQNAIFSAQINSRAVFSRFRAQNDILTLHPACLHRLHHNFLQNLRRKFSDCKHRFHPFLRKKPLSNDRGFYCLIHLLIARPCVFCCCGCGWFCRFLLLLRADSYLIRRRTIGRAAEPFIADHFPILIHLFAYAHLAARSAARGYNSFAFRQIGVLLHDFRRLVNCTLVNRFKLQSSACIMHLMPVNIHDKLAAACVSLNHNRIFGVILEFQILIGACYSRISAQRHIANRHGMRGTLYHLKLSQNDCII